MLDQETREKLEARLLDEIADAEERVMELEASTAPIAPDKALGRLTRLDAMQDKSVREAALVETRKRLSGLELALTKVWSNDFGRCVSCEEGIGLERLVALPESTQCVACAEKRGA